MNIRTINTEHFCNQCHAGLNKHLGGYLLPSLSLETKYNCNCCGTIYNLKNKDGSTFEEKFEIAEHDINILNAFVEKKLSSPTYNLQPIVVPLIWNLFNKSKNYLNMINKSLIYTSEPFFLNFGLHALAMALGVKIHLQFVSIHDTHQEYKTNVSQLSNQPFTIIVLCEEFNGESPIQKIISPAEITYLCIKDTRNTVNKSFAYPKVISLV